MTPRAELALPVDDLAIARRIAGGERAAFELLMRRYNARLYRLARASLQDEADAKDALQDAYLQAFRSIGQFRGDAALSTWLSRLVLNECSARRRRSLRRNNIIPLVSSDCYMDDLANVADAAELPENSIDRGQMRVVLERKVGELPAIFRVVFVMRSVDEVSFEEIAAVLGISQEAARSRHFRAKGMLRESLARELDLAEGDVFEFGGADCDAVVARVLARLHRDL